MNLKNIETWFTANAFKISTAEIKKKKQLDQSFS